MSTTGAVRAVKRGLHRVAATVVAGILRPGAINDPKNKELWRRRGIYIEELGGFYGAFPDPDCLSVDDPPPSPCPGLALNPEGHVRFLREVAPRFADELRDLTAQPPAHGGFVLDNDAFRGIDPLVLYCLLRGLAPRRVMEVGSGNSTVLIKQVLARNGVGELTTIDPYPLPLVRGLGGAVRLVTSPVERIPADAFLVLEENDVLFVDSSHVLRTGGDIQFLINEVLPRLRDGVVVHFHDIHLPFDYPRQLLLDRWVPWTEQYVLRAYLTKNREDEVVFGSRYALHAFPDLVAQAFPGALEMSGGSFWLRIGARAAGGR